MASGGVDKNGECGGRMDYRVNVDGKMLFGSWEGDPHDIIAIPGQGLGTRQKNPWDIAGYIYPVFWQAENDIDLTSDVGVFLRDTWGFELYYDARQQSAGYSYRAAPPAPCQCECR